MTRKPFCSIAGTSSAIVRRNIETKKMIVRTKGRAFGPMMGIL